MGRRGPRPQEGKRAAASIAAKAVTLEALALATIPPCPDELTGAAREAWIRFSRLAFDTGRLTAADLPALELLCYTWAEYLAASEIADNPEQCYCYGENGGVYPHPAVNRQSSARKQLCTMFARFGLTPFDRVQVGGAGPTKTSGSAIATFAASRAKGK